MNNCEEDDAHTRKYLLEQVNRGGLCTPTELIYRSCFYNWNFYRTLSAQGSFLDEVYKSRNSKATYVHMATSHMAEGELSSQILKEHCSCNHSFETVFPKICYKMFNLMIRNYTFRINVLFGRRIVHLQEAKCQFKQEKSASLLLKLTLTSH